MVCVDVLPTRDDSAKAAAAYVAKVVRDVVAAKGGARVIFATGASQFEFLQHLVATEGLPWDKVEAFHLDEYVGLPITHGASFRGYLQERLFSKVTPSFKAVNLLDPAELGAYEAALRAGPIDLACIGIGENGHLAFNDPPCVFDEEKLVKIVDLPVSCRQQQVGEGWFASVDEAPAQAATLTMPAIMRAERLSVVCPDERKADAVLAATEGPLTADCPASALRNHAHVVLWLDAPAASKLSKATIEGTEAKPE